MKCKIFINIVFLTIFNISIPGCSSDKPVEQFSKKDDIVQNIDLKQKYSNKNLNGKVKLLIEQLLDPNTQQSAVDKLVNLEPEATAYIIMNMDDYRELPDKTITLVNKSPNAFEAHRFIGVRKVADALSEILTQREGKFFINKSIKDITDNDRKKDIYSWKKWLLSKSKK